MDVEKVFDAAEAVAKELLETQTQRRVIIAQWEIETGGSIPITTWIYHKVVPQKAKEEDAKHIDPTA